MAAHSMLPAVCYPLDIVNPKSIGGFMVSILVMRE